MLAIVHALNLAEVRVKEHKKSLVWEYKMMLIVLSVVLGVITSGCSVIGLKLW